jgi:class 3 adenylate cyclase
MPVSLRFVIGAVTATIVLVVASITLAITYSVSIAAVRDAGESLAGAIVTAVELDVRQYFGQMETHLNAIQKVAHIPGYKLPSDEDTLDGEWKEKWILPMRAMMMEVNYSYTSIAMIYEDGSLAVTTSTSAGVDVNYVSEAGQAAVKNSSGAVVSYARSQRYLNKRTQKWWDPVTQGPEPPSMYGGDQRPPGYYYSKSLLASREICLYFPPSPNTLLFVVPEFVLFALCGVYNGSRTELGQVSIGRGLAAIDSFLLATHKTPNTQIFAIDSSTDHLIVGSTHPHKSTAFYTTAQKSRTAKGCQSTLITSPAAPEQIGCQTPASEHPYAPLSAMAKTNAYKDLMYTSTRATTFKKLDGQNYYVISVRVGTTFTSYQLNLVLFLPEEDILGNIVAGRNIAIAVTAAVFVVAATLSILLVGALLAPIDAVAKRMYLTAQLSSEKDLSDIQKPVRAIDDDASEFEADSPEDAPMKKSNMAEIRALQTAYTTMDTAIRSFTRYVPRDVVKELMATNQMCEIQMRPMRCSMLFTDIAGFTSICERVPAPMLSGLVRLYFERASRIVMSHGGVIDKFIGDCIMAVWGAPIPIDTHEVRSSVCAVMLVRETEQNPLLEEFAKAGEKLVIRVGVATGEVLAGNMGSRMRMNYTVIGDEVNLASRLEGLNKQWGTSVMVSESTAEECTEYLAMRYVISIAVVGKQEPVKVFEVLGVLNDAPTEKLGAITSDNSENRTMAQVGRDRDLEEMAARYGEIKSTSVGPMTTGKLLRRCLRHITVDDNVVTFSDVYATALHRWNTGDFAGCMETLRSLQTRHDVPTACFERKCVQKILHAAERYLQSPPGPGWTGVWVAEEK